MPPAQEWFRDQICCGIVRAAGLQQQQIVRECIVQQRRLHQRHQLHQQRLSNVTNSYSPGNACDVVLVRATYTWTVWSPGLAQLLNSNNAPNYLVNMADGSGHLLSGTAAFRNEPFNTGVAGC